MSENKKGFQWEKSGGKAGRSGEKGTKLVRERKSSTGCSGELSERKRKVDLRGKPTGGRPGKDD